MVEPKDKRTKAWKEWNTTYGLGDLVEDVVKATGIKKLVGNCKPCEERKKLLNKVPLFKVSKVRRCLTPEQIEAHTKYLRDHKADTWQPIEIDYLIQMYSHVFAIQYNKKDLCRNCNGSGLLLKKLQTQLNAVYEDEKITTLKQI